MRPCGRHRYRQEIKYKLENGKDSDGEFRATSKPKLEEIFQSSVRMARNGQTFLETTKSGFELVVTAFAIG